MDKTTEEVIINAFYQSSENDRGNSLWLPGSDLKPDPAAWKAKTSSIPVSPAGRAISRTHEVYRYPTPLGREPSMDSMRMHADNISRSETPLRPGQQDTSSMQLARLSLDHDEPRPPSATPNQHQLSSTAPMTSPSKKRPADAGAPPTEIEESRIRHSPVSRTCSQPGPHAGRNHRANQNLEPRQFQHPQDAHDSPSGYFPSKQTPAAGIPFQPGPAPAASGSRPTGLESSRPWPKTTEPQMLRELYSCPISPEQLEIEVAGLESDLVAVEKKCIAVDQGHMTAEAKGRPLSNEHWQALTNLHRTLLYQHYDLFLASQHPQALENLRRLASEKQMPLRMWKYAIHAYLEVLRQHLPASYDFMVNFIYLAYQMVSLLYETVDDFKNVWTECLGDLARYRMAIESQDMRDREVWTGVARYWYANASLKQPSVGRLYHHLGILARPNALQQLFYYSKSLTAVVPFRNAKESIKTVFDPELGRARHTAPYASKFDAAFVKVHALIFDGTDLDAASAARSEVCGLLLEQIAQTGPKWKEYGVFVVLTCISACFGYSPERRVFGEAYGLIEKNENDAWPDSTIPPWMAFAIELTFDLFKTALTRLKDRNILPQVHLVLAFIVSLCRLRDTPKTRALGLYCIRRVPWPELAAFLNMVGQLETVDGRTVKAGMSDDFLQPERGDARPLPEDHLIRGLAWCRYYFPTGWFDKSFDEESRLLELASTHTLRAQRILYLAIHISQKLKFLVFDTESRTFKAPPSSRERTSAASLEVVRAEEMIATQNDMDHAPMDSATGLSMNADNENTAAQDLNGTNASQEKSARTSPKESPQQSQSHSPRKSNEHNKVCIIGDGILSPSG